MWHPVPVLVLLCASIARAETSLVAVGDGLALEPAGSALGALRVHFIGGADRGYDVVFERRAGAGWREVARMPEGAWTVYTDWRDGWYDRPLHARAQVVERAEGAYGGAIASGVAATTFEPGVAAATWRFRDRIVLDGDFVRIDRSFEYTAPSPLGTVTLATRVRLPLGGDIRTLIPGSIYNGNPGSTLAGPRLSSEPGAIGLYEEHRLPIPMANVESSVGGGRLHGSILTVPSRIAHGHKGDDQWWSLGLEFGTGWVDLVSASGPVATNGRRSTIYGHRNGFDPYDEAYLDLPGPAAFTKTMYLDLGSGEATGQSFRRTVWKAFDVLRPLETPHLPFDEAMALKLTYAKTTFFRSPAGAAGYCWFPWPNRVFQYSWCGGGESIAWAMICEAERTGDEQARRHGIEAIDFYLRNGRAKADGLYYGDCQAEENRWVPGGFHGGKPGISSRQFGEIFDRLCDAVLQARRMRLPQAAEWERHVRAAGEFLLRSPRIRGMFPRAWTEDGAILPGPSESGTLSAAGATCVAALARIGGLVGEPSFVRGAAEAMDAYAAEFLSGGPMAPWGATLDAGGEDKEAGTGLLHAALEVHQATGEKRFLEHARAAADWSLTLVYFHDVGVRKDSLLHGHLNTVGWTFISVQNQEIDVFAYWFAFDFYRLGQEIGDDRYRRLAKLLFDACTQTIARPGAMFGQVAVGIQAEHYNHSNCTYVGGEPQTWRGTQHSVGICWTHASALYGGTKLALLAPADFPLPSPERELPVPTSRRRHILWRYTTGEPAANWMSEGFDDSAWQEGPGGFGEYGTPGGVVGTFWRTKDIYLRREITLKDKPASPQLLIHHDDEAEVYLNGVLGARIKGYVVDYQTIPIAPEAAAALRPGRNVLAVHCRQDFGGQYIDVGIIEP